MRGARCSHRQTTHVRHSTRRFTGLSGPIITPAQNSCCAAAVYEQDQGVTSTSGRTSEDQPGSAPSESATALHLQTLAWLLEVKSGLPIGMLSLSSLDDLQAVLGVHSEVALAGLEGRLWAETATPAQHARLSAQLQAGLGGGSPADASGTRRALRAAVQWACDAHAHHDPLPHVAMVMLRAAAAALLSSSAGDAKGRKWMASGHAQSSSSEVKIPREYMESLLPWCTPFWAAPLTPAERRAAWVASVSGGIAAGGGSSGPSASSASGPAPSSAAASASASGAQPALGCATPRFGEDEVVGQLYAWHLLSTLRRMLGRHGPLAQDYVDLLTAAPHLLHCVVSYSQPQGWSWRGNVLNGECLRELQMVLSPELGTPESYAAQLALTEPRLLVAPPGLVTPATDTCALRVRALKRAVGGDPSVAAAVLACVPGLLCEDEESYCSVTEPRLQYLASIAESVQLAPISAGADSSSSSSSGSSTEELWFRSPKLLGQLLYGDGGQGSEQSFRDAAWRLLHNAQ